MPKRASNTHTIEQIIRFYSEATMEYFLERFAKRSQQQGTVVVHDVQKQHMGGSEWLLSLEYSHTCANAQNWRSDALRFVQNAMKGTTARYVPSLPTKLAETPVEMQLELPFATDIESA